MVTEVDRGRTTCVIETQIADKMVEEKENNKKSYTEMKKGSIKTVKKKVNKKVKAEGVICEKIFKDLKLHLLMIASAR